MKKLIISLLFIVVTVLTCNSQTIFPNYFFYINSDGSEYILQSVPDSYGTQYIRIVLSDMLSASFVIKSAKQIDNRTIRYKCSKYYQNMYESLMDKNVYYITKQKCENGKYTYFWEFPPLYEGDKSTVYKTVKKH